MLWGKPAQQKASLVDSARHRVLTAPHPSPLAAASGKLFVGCRHFSQANTLLSEQGKPAIDWCIRP
jgi:uracil-DNA glycosylase